MWKVEFRKTSNHEKRTLGISFMVARWFRFLVLYILLSIHGMVTAEIIEPLPQSNTQYSGTLGDKDVYRFQLAEYDAIKLTVEQVNADVMLKVINEVSKEEFFTSIPARDWLDEEVVVTTQDCNDCRIHIMPAEFVDQSGTYQLKVEFLNEKQDANEIEYLQLMTKASRTWLALAQANSSLENVQALLTQTLQKAKLISPLAIQRSLYLSSQIASGLANFAREKELLKKTLEIDDTPTNPYYLRALLALGITDYINRKFDAALDKFERVKRLAEQQDQKLLLAKIDSWSGLVAGELGQQDKAFNYFELAYQSFVRAGDWRSAVEGLVNLGWANLRKGNLESALNYYHQALSLAKKTTLSRLEVEANTGLGTTYDRLGDVDQALNHINLALENSGKHDLSVVHGRALQAKAQVLMKSGLFERALDLFEASLAAYDKVNSESDMINIRFYLGRVLANLNRNAEAALNFKEVLEFDKKSGNSYYIATGYHELAVLAFEEKSYQQALQYQEQAIKHVEATDDEHLKGRIYSQAGVTFYFGGEKVRSSEYFKLASTLQEKTQDRMGLIRTYYLQALSMENAGSLATAKERLANAIGLIEIQEQKISRADLRRNYFALQQQISTLMVKLKHRLGEDAASSLELVERFRSRTLIEKIASLGSQKVLPPELAERRAKLQSQLQTTVADYHQLSREAGREEILKATRALSEQIQQLELEINKSQKEMTQQVDLPRTDVAKMQQALSDDTLLLYFDTNIESSYLWSVTRKHIEFFELASAEAIEAKLLPVLNLVRQAPSLDRKNRKKRQSLAFDDLSQLLFGSINIAWDKYTKIVIVPDGPLNYLPFSILTPPGATQSLVTNKQISYVGSLNLLGQLKSRQNPTETNEQLMLLVANPAFKSSQRVADTTPNLRSGFEMKELPYTEKEASSIRSVLGTQVQYLERADASKEKFLKKPLNDFKIIHFATHGLADSNIASLGGLVMSNVKSDNNLLLAPEIVRLTINADLVVLSGCETAIGRLIDGEGLQGVSRAFFEAGARRVVASLWPVQDDATAELMSYFYRSLFVDKKQPVEALRLAKLHVRNFKHKSGRRPWRDPYFWAGFVLQGDGESWIDKRI